MARETQSTGRLYRDLAQRLISDIGSGMHPIGGRLPGERELASLYGVSRGTVREAIIVLEVLGVVEVRMGSGAHVLQPGDGKKATPGASALEVCEALLMIGGEAAALAAREVEPEELAEIESVLDRFRRARPQKAEVMEREFCLAVARGSHNHAVYEMTVQLWDWRSKLSELSASEARWHENPDVTQLAAVVDALRRGDPTAARSAMRTHLNSALDRYLSYAEEVEIAKIRRATEMRRSRFMYAGGRPD